MTGLLAFYQPSEIERCKSGKKGLERSAHDLVSQEASGPAMQKHHLISYVLFRCIRQGDRSDMLELENMRENVDISQLDYNILLTENCEAYSWRFDPDEEDDIKTIMSRNPNVVFL